MPANRRQQTAQSPALSTAQSTAKYINKDGSKFINMSKVQSSTDSSEGSPAMSQPQMNLNGQIANGSQDASGPTTGVNRKKQKRRDKARQAEQAARLAAGSNGAATSNQLDQQSPHDDYLGHANGHYDNAEGEGAYYTDEEDGDAYSVHANHGSPENGHPIRPTDSSLKPTKKKGKKVAGPHSHLNAGHQNHSGQTGLSQKKIWNTSNTEERQSIKEFWLSLGEEERRSLVKVEKEAVLSKMKEQQKHSCSCTVCGRKRVAIEEELEVLYDAYYEELEQYANNQQGAGPLSLPASSRFGAISNLHPPNRVPPTFNGRQPSRARLVEHFDDDGDEEYSEEEADDEEYSDEDPVEEIPRNSHANDFFNFGQSLTVQGGILTVADDLLKNDGKKFIEMMEQLAERRMAREEDAREYQNPYNNPPNRSIDHHHSHNHGPPDDEEYDDEEDEEEDDFDSQEDEYEEEEMDTMTEEQRMEEGRRMFQIFAARMFEQRVLTAWRAKMAIQRQEALLEEERNEIEAEKQRKAKKAKEAQKKKEKAQQKKAALAEEKRKKDEAKAAEEAKLREAEEKKVEEARLKAEEKRKKREAQKKAEEEERLKKEADKQRRLQEQRERQAEQERKLREAKERERKEKEEQRLKEKEAKEARERETRERKEKLEKEKREAEAKVKAEKETREQKRDDPFSHPLAAIPQIPHITKRQQQPLTSPIPIGIQATAPHGTSHVPVATPVVPKAPTPIRPLATSQKDMSSLPQTPRIGKSQDSSPNQSSLKSSPDPSGNGVRGQFQQPFLHQPQAHSPIHSTLRGPTNAFQPGPFSGLQSMGLNGFPPGMPTTAPGFGARIHHDNMYQHPPPMGNQFRPLPGPNGSQIPPGLNGMPMHQGRGFPPPGFSSQLPNSSLLGQPFGSHKEGAPSQSHSRQQSGAFDKPTFDGGPPPTQPIARPSAIGRPSSVVQGMRSSESDMNDVTAQLGSASLLDDSDEPLNNEPSNSGSGGRRASAAPGMGRPPFSQFPPGVPGMDPYGFGGAHSSFSNTWAPPNGNAYTSSSLPGSSIMGGWPHAQNFGIIGPTTGRPSQPRNGAVRQMLCNACRKLSAASGESWINIHAIQKEVEHEGIGADELLHFFDTEGNPNNGGGTFDIRVSGDSKLVRYQPDIPSSLHRPMGAPGEIGSPVAASSSRFGPPGLSGVGF